MDGNEVAQLVEAVEEFNRFRAPEVKARMVGLDGTRLTVEFDGASCRSCGGQDYLEDFAYEASDLLHKRTDLVSFERIGAHGFVGVYEIEE